MNEQRNWGLELQEMWQENKGKIKVGAICLGLGAGIGFFKGVNASNVLFSKALDLVPDMDASHVSDWLYANVDKPEIIDAVRGTIAEIDKLN